MNTDQSLKQNTKQSRKFEKVLTVLLTMNLFLVHNEADIHDIKNDKDEVLFSFKQLKDKTLLESLRVELERLKIKEGRENKLQIGTEKINITQLLNVLK